MTCCAARLGGKGGVLGTFAPFGRRCRFSWSRFQTPPSGSPLAPGSINHPRATRTRRYQYSILNSLRPLANSSHSSRVVSQSSLGTISRCTPVDLAHARSRVVSCGPDGSMTSRSVMLPATHAALSPSSYVSAWISCTVNPCARSCSANSRPAARRVTNACTCRGAGWASRDSTIKIVGFAFLLESAVKTGPT